MKEFLATWKQFWLFYCSVGYAGKQWCLRAPEFSYSCVFAGWCCSATVNQIWSNDTKSKELKKKMIRWVFNPNSYFENLLWIILESVAWVESLCVHTVEKDAELSIHTFRKTLYLFLSDITLTLWWLPACVASFPVDRKMEECFYLFTKTSLTAWFWTIGVWQVPFSC